MPQAPLPKRKKTGKGRLFAYVSRSRALKKLQITLRDFRRLCILKGIYPREPPKRPKQFQGHKAYYHVKDILWIKHEPLLGKYWKMKTWIKKRNKAINTGRRDKLVSLRKRRPKLTYSHLVRERYPDFEDAIRNLNDPLSMIHLFGLVPARKRRAAVKPKSIRRYCRLAKEFAYYVVQTRGLRKSFVSIKGIYYEALIKGQPVVWLVPHKFCQFTPKDVDYAVMATFLNFYETMVRFVNYKLYLTEKLDYPPKFIKGGKKFYMVEKEPKKKKEVQSEAKKIENLEKIIEKAETTEPEGAKEVEMAQAPKKKKYLEKRCTLFEGLVFLLNRETPQEALEFVVTAMGGNCIWQQATRKTGVPKSVTHQIIDRPTKTGEPPVWEMVQPQWVFDCLNVGVRIPVGPYAPGKMCPPHLSPFQTEDSAYEPKQAAVLREWAKMGKTELDELEAEAEVEDIEKEEEEQPESGEQEVVVSSDGEDGVKDDEEESKKDEDKEERAKKRKRDEDVDQEEQVMPTPSPDLPPAKKKRTIKPMPPPILPPPKKKKTRPKPKKQPKKIRRRDIDQIPNLEERKKLLPRKHRFLFHLMEKTAKEWQEEGDVLRRKAELLEKEGEEKEAAEKGELFEEKESEKDSKKEEVEMTDSSEMKEEIKVVEKKNVPEKEEELVKTKSTEA